LIILAGIFSALVCQLFTVKPQARHIHVKSFRYGKDPWVIRCNRGDTLHLTFSTNDTGHSFFLQEFDVDVKVSPARDQVEIFSTSDPTIKPVTSKELTFVTRFNGIKNYFVSKINYRCHVWCGPMHAFEQGKLIILPNTLVAFGAGSLSGIFLLWVAGLRKSKNYFTIEDERNGFTELTSPGGFLRKIVVSRIPQIVLIVLAMTLIYFVILVSLFGTKMSGRNLGVLLMWAVWLFLLVAFLTPFLGKSWCTICPLPFLGDLLQRKSALYPVTGKTGNYNNKFSGLFRRWPGFLRNDWLKLILFLTLATFSTTLIAVPKVSGITVLMLMLVPVLFSSLFELRAFCRYICPVSVFISPFSRMSPVALRNRSQEICNRCKPRYCETGNVSGWACPQGLNVGNIRENTDCTLCLECMRSCSYGNVSLYRRPAASETGTRSMSEAWMTIAVFTTAMIYSILYLGPWPAIRDFVNIMDKQNWNLFGIYAISLWFIVLVLVPAILFFTAWSGKRLSGSSITARQVFLGNAGALMPLGLVMWIAFVIPMLFVNITFIIQSISDPFGWGWDFFGTANLRWHQFLPEYIPWFQVLLILIGAYLSLRNLSRTWSAESVKGINLLRLCFPTGALLVIVGAMMMIFFAA
jgi:polyferredoxin